MDLRYQACSARRRGHRALETLWTLSFANATIGNGQNREGAEDFSAWYYRCLQHRLRYLSGRMRYRATSSDAKVGTGKQLCGSVFADFLEGSALP